MEEHDSTFKSAKIRFDDSERGNRKVIATGEFERGEIILIEPYLIIEISKDFVTKCCHYCLEEPKHPERCSGCKVAHYCSSSHQMLDWKRGHNKECKIVSKLASSSAGPSEHFIMIKLFVQIVLRQNETLKTELLKLKAHPESELFNTKVLEYLTKIQQAAEVE